jgi:hypothetical protein
MCITDHVGYLTNSSFSVFECSSIAYQWRSFENNAANLQHSTPDLTDIKVAADLLQFLPGVSASLMTFLIFGTTKGWKQYRRLLLCERRGKQSYLPQNRSFERLETPPPQSSTERELELLGRDSVVDDRFLESKFNTTKPLANDPEAYADGQMSKENYRVTFSKVEP